jgi:hypothetical protein
MYEIFKDSPAIQWIQEDGRADERKKLIAMFQQTVLKFVDQHYPKLQRLAKAQVRLLEDPERIQQLILDLSMAQDGGEAENVLLSLQEDNNEENTDATEIVSPEP